MRSVKRAWAVPGEWARERSACAGWIFSEDILSVDRLSPIEKRGNSDPGHRREVNEIERLYTKLEGMCWLV